jgi:hypothetical protein
MKGDIKINDITLTANGYTKLTEGFINFEVKERTIDNTLVSDFFGVKRTFKISWEKCVISGDLLDSFIEIYLAGEDVTFIKTNYDLTETTYTCKLYLPDSFMRAYEKDNYGYDSIEVSLEEV